MIFTIEELITFFDKGVADGATHMVVVTDGLGQSEPPVYVMQDENYLMVRQRCQRNREDISTDLYYLDKPRGAQIYRSRQVRDILRRRYGRFEDNG